MTTADDIRDLALALARTEPDEERAVMELDTLCGGRRVSAVRARQLLVTQLDDPADQDSSRALRLLDELLVRLPA